MTFEVGKPDLSKEVCARRVCPRTDLQMIALHFTRVRNIAGFFLLHLNTTHPLYLVQMAPKSATKEKVVKGDEGESHPQTD